MKREATRNMTKNVYIKPACTTIVLHVDNEFLAGSNNRETEGNGPTGTIDPDTPPTGPSQSKQHNIWDNWDE